MAQVTPFEVEIGYSTEVEFAGDVVVKTSRLGMDPVSAEECRLSLIDYAGQLSGEPIPVASLRGTGLVRRPDGYHVQHSMDVVDGPSVVRLSAEQKHISVAQMIGHVCNMSTMPCGDRLRVPIDGAARNWHCDADRGPVLIDIFPSFPRDTEGNLKDGSPYFEKWYGTQSGLAAKILFGAVDLEPGATRGQRLRNLALRGIDDWAYDALPDTANPRVRDEVRRHVRAHFAPYVVAMAVHRIKSKLTGA